MTLDSFQSGEDVVILIITDDGFYGLEIEGPDGNDIQTYAYPEEARTDFEAIRSGIKTIEQVFAWGH